MSKIQNFKKNSMFYQVYHQEVSFNLQKLKELLYNQLK
jgi:hypothetical protein